MRYLLAILALVACTNTPVDVQPTPVVEEPPVVVVYEEPEFDLPIVLEGTFNPPVVLPTDTISPQTWPQFVDYCGRYPEDELCLNLNMNE